MIQKLRVTSGTLLSVALLASSMSSILGYVRDQNSANSGAAWEKK
jgi:hypothetical protein